MSTWLVTGRMPKAHGTQAATEASVLESVDGELARAFRESAELQTQLALTEEELVDAARDVSLEPR